MQPLPTLRLKRTSYETSHKQTLKQAKTVRRTPNCPCCGACLACEADLAHKSESYGGQDFGELSRVAVLVSGLPGEAPERDNRPGILGFGARRSCSCQKKILFQ